MLLDIEYTSIKLVSNFELVKTGYFLLFFLVLSILLFCSSFFIIFQQEDIEKVSAYECGFQPFEDTRLKFDVRYYIVGILFLIFDLEIMFLFPWAVIGSSSVLFNFFVLFLFIGLLFIAFAYELFKGALL